MRRSRLWFSIRRVMFVVAIAAVSAACLIGEFLSIWRLSTPIGPAPPPLWSNTDSDLFNVVLSDIVDSHEIGPKAQIVCSNRPPRMPPRHLKEVLGDEIKDVPGEVRDDVLRRNPEETGYSLSRYQPSNPNILVQDMRVILQADLPFDRQFPNAVGYIGPFLPGYSRDGRTALFYFNFGPSGHGAAGYYLLRKVEGRWEIIVKGFYIFPHDDGLLSGRRITKWPGLKTVDQAVP